MKVEATPEQDAMVQAFARAVEQAGGKALLVGGLVRDEILGLPSKDFDFEVFGLPMERVQAILQRFGNVKEVGQQFGVLNIQELDWDVALPRREQKTGEGHKGFDVVPDPTMSIEDAARRRDLTINALSKDPLTGEIIDPLNGMADLQAGILRMADPNTFGDDPLRALRVAQFAARFDFDVEPETLKVVAAQPLEQLPGERILPEFSKMLLKGQKPSKGIEVLRQANLLRYFPEIEALQGVPQEPKWHPEGDVFIHTMMVLDEAGKQRTGDPEFDLPLMLGALAHDFGKPGTTKEIDGKITSRGHEEAGVGPTNEFMTRMKAPLALTKQVETLVDVHLRPATLPGKGTRKGYRKLGRTLQDAGVSPELLTALSKSDMLGRTTEQAMRRDTSTQDQFLQEYTEHVTSQAPAGGKLVDSVSGKHLIAKGFKPGPDMGKFLALTRSIEDETGVTDPDKLIELATRFLKDRSEGGGSQEGNQNDCGDSHIREGEECFDGDYREQRKKGNTKSTLSEFFDWAVGRPCEDGEEKYPEKCTGPGSSAEDPYGPHDDVPDMQWDMPEEDMTPYQPGDELAVPPELQEPAPEAPAPPMQLGPGAWELPFSDEELNNPEQDAADKKMLKQLEKENKKADRAGQDLEKTGDKAWRDAKKLQQRDEAKKAKDLAQRQKISDRDAAKRQKEWMKNESPQALQLQKEKQDAADLKMLNKEENKAAKEAAKQEKIAEKARNDAAKKAAKLSKEQEDGLKRAEQEYDKLLRNTPKNQVPQGMDFQKWLEYILMGPDEEANSSAKGPSAFRTHPDKTQPDFLLWEQFDMPVDQKGKSLHPGLASVSLGEPQRLHERSEEYPGVKDFDRGSRFSEHPLEGPLGRDGFGGSTPSQMEELEPRPNGMTPETGIFPDWTDSDTHGQPQLPLTRPHEHEDPTLPATDPHDFTNVDFLDWDESPTHAYETPNDKQPGFMPEELPYPEMPGTNTPHPSPTRGSESPPSSFPGQMVRKPGGGGLDRAPMMKPNGAPQETGFLPVQNEPDPERNMFKSELDPTDVHGPGGNNPGGTLNDQGRGGRGGGTKRRDYWDMDYTGKKSGFQSIEPPETNIYPAGVEAARTMEDLMDIESIFPHDYNPDWKGGGVSMGPSIKHQNTRKTHDQGLDPFPNGYGPDGEILEGDVTADDDANIEQKQVQPLIPNQKMAIAVDPNGPMGERIIIVSPLFEEISPAIMVLRSHRFERHGGIVIDGPPEWLLGITPRLEALDKSSGQDGAGELYARVHQLIQSAGMPIEYEQEPRP